MALSNRDRRALIIGAVGLGVVVAYLLIIEPLLTWHDNLAADHDMHAARLARLIAENRQLERLAGEITIWETEAGELTEPGVYSVQISKVREGIINAAQSSGTNLKGPIPATRGLWADDPALAKVTMRIEAESQWPKVFEFVAAIERVHGVLSIEDFDIQADPKKGDKLDLALTISVLVESEDNGGALWAG